MNSLCSLLPSGYDARCSEATRLEWTVTWPPHVHQICQPKNNPVTQRNVQMGTEFAATFLSENPCFTTFQWRKKSGNQRKEISTHIELNMLSRAVKAKPIANMDFIFTWKYTRRRFNFIFWWVTHISLQLMCKILLLTGLFCKHL